MLTTLLTTIQSWLLYNSNSIEDDYEIVEKDMYRENYSKVMSELVGNRISKCSKIIVLKFPKKKVFDFNYYKQMVNKYKKLGQSNRKMQNRIQNKIQKRRQMQRNFERKTKISYLKQP